jgi:hypothetical protein
MTGASLCGSQSDATRNFGTSFWHPPKLQALPSPQTVDFAPGIYLILVRQKELISAEGRTLSDDAEELRFERRAGTQQQYGVERIAINPHKLKVLVEMSG